MKDETGPDSSALGQMLGKAAPSKVRRWTRQIDLRYAIAAAGLLVIGAGFYWRVLAPVHGVHHIADCARAYAAAKTRTDSLSVDLMSYPDSIRRGVNRKCGLLHPAQISLEQR